MTLSFIVWSTPWTKFSVVDPHHFDADPDVGPTYQSHADRNSSYGIRIPDKDTFNLGFLLASKNVKPPVKEQTEGPNYYGKQFRIVFMFNDAPPPLTLQYRFSSNRLSGWKK